jgi:hypothetical protein
MAAVDTEAGVMPVFLAVMVVGMAAITVVVTVVVQCMADIMAEGMAGAGMGRAMLVGTEEEGIPTGTLGGMEGILIICIMDAVIRPSRGTGKPDGNRSCRGIWKFMFLRIPMLTAAPKQMAIRL